MEVVMKNKQGIELELLVVGCVIIGLCLVGCRALNKMWDKATEDVFIMPSLPEGPSLSNVQFDDIPVPLNFKHLPKESAVYVHSDIRTASLRYLGSARIEDIENFYLKQMPYQKWEFKTSLALEQKKKLLFEKGSERCEVIVENKGTDSYLDIMINHK
jgi:hypothetical protein